MERKEPTISNDHLGTFNCEHCGYINSITDEKCLKCGEKIIYIEEEEKNENLGTLSCEHCGYINSKTDKQCLKCGEKINNFDEEKKTIMEKASNQKKCPYCAELIQLEAAKCRYCGEYLDKKLEKKKLKEQKIIVEKKYKKKKFGFFNTLFWILLIVVFVYLYNQPEETTTVSKKTESNQTTTTKTTNNTTTKTKSVVLTTSLKNKIISTIESNGMVTKAKFGHDEVGGDPSYGIFWIWMRKDSSKDYDAIANHFCPVFKTNGLSKIMVSIKKSGTYDTLGRGYCR